MNWKTTQDGDLRIIKRFAWLPVDLSDEDVTLWLEFYWSKEIFQCVGFYSGWAWVSIFRSKKEFYE